MKGFTMLCKNNHADNYMRMTLKNDPFHIPWQNAPRVEHIFSCFVYTLVFVTLGTIINSNYSKLCFITYNDIDWPLFWQAYRCLIRWRHPAVVHSRQLSIQWNMRQQEHNTCSTVVTCGQSIKYNNRRRPTLKKRSLCTWRVMHVRQASH